MSKPVILIVQDYYLPAYKGGGSLRTVVNIVNRLHDQFDFHVLARDRDVGDDEPLPGVEERWMQREGCKVKYLPPARITPWGLARAIRDVDYELIYANSFFSQMTVWLLVLRWFGRLPRRTPFVLAPRGELGAGALAGKRAKKTVFMRLAQAIGLYGGVIWHASSEREREETLRWFDGPVKIAADLPAPPPDRNGLRPPEKRSGSARFVFLSRLARKKNLSYALELLRGAEGEVTFDIYGTAEDPAYLRECEELMARLPDNVRCTYHGPVPYEKVHETFATSHVFFFPTLNENFGHVILEALLVGLPLLISNETFWVGLAQRDVGYDLPLGDDDAFVACLNRFTQMGPDEYLRLSENAVALARSYLHDPAPAEAQARLFREVLEGRD